MNLIQLYETLILRDVMFYMLPGSLSLLGVSLIVWVQIPDSWRNLVTPYALSNGWIIVALLLVLGYVFGHILYILHNSTIGKLKSLKRDEIMNRFLDSTSTDDDASNLILTLRQGLINAVVSDVKGEDQKNILKKANLLQVYFTADKYIRLKSIDFYAVYISRLTATSRFYGVMSVGWAILSLSCVSFFFTGVLPTILNIIIILVLCLLSYRFIRQSITDQQELVWNVVQATYLLHLEEKRSFDREKELKAIEESIKSKKAG